MSALLTRQQGVYQITNICASNQNKIELHHSNPFDCQPFLKMIWPHDTKRMDVTRKDACAIPVHCQVKIEGDRSNVLFQNNFV
jgi:hypothetical protein